MAATEDLEKGGQTSRPLGSSSTSANASRNPSAQSSPFSSRNSSTEQLNLRPMKFVKESSRHTHRFLSHELDASWMGGIVIICFFTSGLIDSVAFNTWNCFVGMQTGNTVFAALGLGGQPEATHFQQYYKSLVSIGAFCLGALFFNALHRYPTGLSNQASSRRRWIFALSFLLQAVFIAIAATLVSSSLVSNQPFRPGTFSSGKDSEDDGTRDTTNYVDLVPIALLAFQAAGQCCLSRVLGLIELPTIVLSTLFHDFTADLYGIGAAWENSKSLSHFIFVEYRRQEKRLASILALFVGAVCGSEMFKSNAGMAGALWTAVGLKAGVTLMLLLWRKDSSEEQSLSS